MTAAAIAALKADAERHRSALANLVEYKAALAADNWIERRWKGEEIREVPDDDKVICPNCTHQFRAIPVNVQAEIDALKADTEEREQMLRNARMMICAMVLSNGGQFHVTRTAMENVASDDYELVQSDEFTTGAFVLTVTRAARAEKPHG